MARSRTNSLFQSRYGVVALLGLSLVAHASVVATADFEIGGDEVAASRVASVGDIDYRYSCWADAMLAASSQGLACMAPGLGDSECGGANLATLHMDLRVCDELIHDEAVPSEAIAMLSPEEISQIEAEPLLDVPELDQLEAEKLFEEKIEEKVEEAQERISNPTERGQVVELVQPAVEVTPSKARFLSEFDMAVEKETVARGSTEEMVQRPGPKELPIDEEPDELPDEIEPSGEKEEIEVAEAQAENSNESESSEAGPKSREPLLAMRELEAREDMTKGIESPLESALAANGFLRPTGTGDRNQRGQEAQEGQDAVQGGTGGGPVIPSLRPSEETLQRLAGGGSVDKLDGVESGEVTALNSKKWKFASFFNRMKRQVAQNWHPDRVYVRRDPTGKVYGTKDRVTVLEVSLKPNGSLAKVVVFKQSGVDFLDEEAIKAFELAQPFPNPPGGLVDKSSQLITFSFGFHFQVGQRRDAWKVFRYN